MTRREKLGRALADQAELAARIRAVRERAEAAERANGWVSAWDAFHSRGFMFSIPVYDGIETDVPCGQQVPS